MAQTQPFFNKFLYFALLLFHLGCFFFPSSKKLKTTTSLKLHKNAFSWSYIKHKVFSFKSKTKTKTILQSPITISPRPSIVTSTDTILFPISTTPSRKPRQIGSNSTTESEQSFPLRNNIYPCSTCGEVFHKPQHLEQHQSIKHAISELYNNDSSRNIVSIIFKSSWNNNNNPNPVIHQILKIHNSPKILAKFEEYRESVKLKAGRVSVSVRRRDRDERCVADGNELLRFHCSTFVCNLGQNGNSSICTQCYCSVCGIVRSGFSPKLDGISTLSSSWRAHVALPEDLEDEFAFMNVKRAMLVCRVVAGRVGRDDDGGYGFDKEDSGFDSVSGSGNGAHSRLDEEELLVFNPRAVLPCFAIIYSVQ
ncbi:hypothetical protein GIB67_027396 [Kingdonia uniflora]|uniref:C2H2-type domain-containing protein n=1 Tax=Kingdonia uniflora TaxID=39325 RepID=A0A7J7MF26_9MAGN|nr:hypothetical protein GIB67_027396 [Kingdonia uniflora]